MPINEPEQEIGQYVYILGRVFRHALEEEVRSLRQETKSIRAELERVSTIEKHLGISTKA